MSTIQAAQKITDKARESVDFVYATNEKTFIKIYITYSRSGQSARGAIWAYNDVDTYHDTASAQGCGYSKKDSILGELLSGLQYQAAFKDGMPDYPIKDRGNGTELDKLTNAGYTVISM